MKFKFEKLRVWQQAIDFAHEIHLMTRSFPKEELFILTSQIKRAADSVALNIAEGSTGQTDAQFSKFLGYAIRSGVEVVTCLYLAKKRDFSSITKNFKVVNGRQPNARPPLFISCYRRTSSRVKLWTVVR